MTTFLYARFVRERKSAEQPRTGPGSPPFDAAVPYEAPSLIDLGHVREVTLGSSPSGSADANAQYYW
ncbi:lasso RiPP family leader peptide-containing protein [Streptomyces sp. NPDC057877]|uniref:lasso RiPP family leader peptide-containing protein n=1 Tax=Streptomyces sp. NPDC057877 TaxID=3346269 RepID=UPI00369C4F51